MSPNGSMTTVTPPALQAEGRLAEPLNVHGAPRVVGRAPPRRSGSGRRAAATPRGDQAGDDRERERRVQAVPERARDQLREEARAGERRPGWPARARAACAGRAGSGSGCSPGTRRTGSRPAAGRRRAGRSRRRRRAPGARALIVCGSVEASPTIISVKKMPIESTWAEFWKVWFIAPPAPRCSSGRLFMIAARLGEANMPIESAEQHQDRGEHRVREVGRQQPSAARS